MGMMSITSADPELAVSRLHIGSVLVGHHTVGARISYTGIDQAAVVCWDRRTVTRSVLYGRYASVVRRLDAAVARSRPGNPGGARRISLCVGPAGTRRHSRRGERTCGWEVARHCAAGQAVAYLSRRVKAKVPRRWCCRSRAAQSRRLGLEVAVGVIPRIATPLPGH